MTISDSGDDAHTMAVANLLGQLGMQQCVIHDDRCTPEARQAARDNAVSLHTRIKQLDQT
jgi:hypothetical protein